MIKAKKFVAKALRLLAGKLSKLLLSYARRLDPVFRDLSPLPSALPVEAASASEVIVVTTFSKRFFQNCVPMIRDIRNAGVEQPIYVVINGDKGQHDEIYRSDFLREISKIEGINPIAFGSQRGVAAMWNAGIRYSDAAKILVLNDDLLIDQSSVKSSVLDLFEALNEFGLVTIANSFGHFGVSRACIDNIGWFDERFLGFGEEDGDFIWRYVDYYGQLPGNIDVYGLINEASQVGHEELTSTKGRYSLFNKAYLEVKYDFSKGSVAGSFGIPAEKVQGERDPFSTDFYRRRMLDLLDEQNASFIKSEVRRFLQADQDV